MSLSTAFRNASSSSETKPSTTSIRSATKPYSTTTKPSPTSSPPAASATSTASSSGLYLEARPDLSYLPIKSPDYRHGYSLEMLRDLAALRDQQLETDETRNGTFFDATLKILFRLIFDGHNSAADLLTGDFAISPLDSTLFDPASLPILSKVTFRNHILQQVIQKLSYGRHGKSKQLARISYAQLGINQLGAVYENLLSYSGQFAPCDWYEVKPAKELHDPTKHAYFVPHSALSHYTADEIVEDPANKKEFLLHPAKKFLYRLRGRARKQSASYYTPESLTQCLVKYALKELIGTTPADPQWKDSEEILTLTVCEPAVGSAAFLNEAINQLAQAYLDRAQAEQKHTIPADDFPRELQKVKMRLADNNIFGVDLNPTAKELAEISLWLNTIHEGAFVPWFGLQLECGNSLIGARRHTYPKALVAAQTKKATEKPRWPDTSPTERRISTPAHKTPADDIYHWLLGDPAMSTYSDKTVKSLAKSQITTLNGKVKDFCRPADSHEIEDLLALTQAADTFWEEIITQMRDLRQKTTDPLQIYPAGSQTENPEPPAGTYLSTREKDQAEADRLLNPEGPYARLKLALDYWCALWFWPIDQADHFPTRHQFLLDLSLILGVKKLASAPNPEQTDLFTVRLHGQELQAQPTDELAAFSQKHGRFNVASFLADERHPHRRSIQALQQRHRFFHWELTFADQLAPRPNPDGSTRPGGFDLILGNPPWVKVEWNQGDLLSERNPAFAIRKLSAPQIEAARQEEFGKDPATRAEYFAEYESFEGTQAFLNATQNYPLLKGQQTNLYKCFLPQAWRLTGESGVSGFLHPEGVYDDPNAGALRRQLYRKLRYHFEFQNKRFLFDEVHDETTYSVNIYAEQKNIPSFKTISNIFDPSTVDQSLEEISLKIADGIKNAENKWNLIGHQDRVLKVGEKELSLLFTIALEHRP